MMRIPPHPDGHGGNQRAWFLINALRRIDTVHLALIYPASDTSAASVSLDRVRGIVDGITVFPCADWGATSERRPRIPWGIGAWIDLMRIGSVDAPRLSRATMQALARALPDRAFDTVFAARTSVAMIADGLLGRGLLRAKRRIIDIDDIMSQFRRRELEAQARVDGAVARLIRANWRTVQLREIAVLERAEAMLAASWDATGVCSDEDVASLKRRVPQARLQRLPNVVDRPLLVFRSGASARLLFVGNLQFAPNSHGLTWFLTHCWPLIRQMREGVRLTVVGMAPSSELRALLDAPDIGMFANVPQVAPYYADADIILSPIFFGGGTRIKIVEAMAFGRPVVSTTMGVEGLGVVDARDALLADTAEQFAAAVVRLAGDPALRQQIASNARVLQQGSFSRASLDRAVTDIIRLAEVPWP